MKRDCDSGESRPRVGSLGGLSAFMHSDSYTTKILIQSGAMTPSILSLATPSASPRLSIVHVTNIHSDMHTVES